MIMHSCDLVIRAREYAPIFGGEATYGTVVVAALRWFALDVAAIASSYGDVDLGAMRAEENGPGAIFVCCIASRSSPGEDPLRSRVEFLSSLKQPFVCHGKSGRPVLFYLFQVSPARMWSNRQRCSGPDRPSTRQRRRKFHLSTRLGFDRFRTFSSAPKRNNACMEAISFPAPRCLTLCRRNSRVFRHRLAEFVQCRGSFFPNEFVSGRGLL